MADVVACGHAEPVVVCGRNEALRARLVAAGRSHVLGWVENMAELIRACDVVVQNAGGADGLRGTRLRRAGDDLRCLPGHGRTNAAALDADGSVPWIRSPDDLRRHLASVLAVQPTVRAVPEQPVAEVTR